MDDLLADFVAETREMLAACENEIVAWERDPADRAHLDSLFRFVHTVKGNCGFFNFPALASLSHAAESALEDVRRGKRVPDAVFVTAILAIIDRIAAMIASIEAGEPLAQEGCSELIDALASQVGKSSASPAPALPQPDSLSLAIDDAPANAIPYRSIRLPVELLDRAMVGVSDMVLARNDLARRLREARDPAELESVFERLSSILSEVRESISHMRMNHIDHLFQTIPRLARDLAAELGKKVSCSFDGGEVALDREIMELIRDPVTHIIRNAIDHGIEPGDKRIAAGKPEYGQIAISARHSGNTIIVSISDDGRGIDTPAIGRKAVRARLVTANKWRKLSARQQQAYLFEPGLSTAREVSAISGRGVGMDVVRANIERLGGAIEVSSVDGEGTTVALRIPLTLSIVPGLTVRLGDQQYAIPQAQIAEIVRSRNAQLVRTRLGSVEMVETRQERMPYVSLARLLGIKGAMRPDGGADSHSSDLPPVLLVTAVGPDTKIAIGVDSIVDHEDLVVKPLAPALQAAGCYAGSTMLGDGRPILILDPREIAVTMGAIAPGTRHQPVVTLKEANETTEDTLSAMTFVDFAGRRCAIRIELVDRVEVLDVQSVERTGSSAHAVIGDQILPLAAFPGPSIALPERLLVLHLNDGKARVLYAVQSLADQIALSQPLVPLPDEPEYEGATLHEGHLVRVLDARSLFARPSPLVCLAEKETPDQLVCRLPDETWAKAILAPLVAEAGYRLAGPQDTHADVTIVTENVKAVDSLSTIGDQAVIAVRLDQEPAGPADTSIFRYDREGMIEALKRHAGGRRK